MRKQASFRSKKSGVEVVPESTVSPSVEDMVEDAVNSDEESQDSALQESEGSDESDDGSESDGEEDVSAIFKRSNVTEDEHASDYESDDAMEESGSPPTASNSRDTEQFTLDLRNMVILSSNQVSALSLQGKQSSEESKELVEIPLEKDHELEVDESFLLTKASEGCTQLLSAIWQLPTEQSDAGPLVNLPGYDEIKIPRALPPPPPKEETKWEKYAKAKGIPLNKEKRSRKVFDETTGTWMFRHGYEKANNNSKEWPIMEVGPNDDPFDDPWEKLRDAKRTRTERNLENRMKNEEKAGNLSKGSTNRVIKSREKSRKLGKIGGNSDRDNALPTGVPVDLADNGNAKNRGKTSTVAALEAVQRSTASLGRFDQRREGEPERKKTLSKMKKRKLELATDKKVIASEGDKSMKILNAVMNGGGVAKEKAIRKGEFAKGETGYDYEYNDGLGASSFKKKKGRAGAGKMKKMTKKRVK